MRQVFFLFTFLLFAVEHFAEVKGMCVGPIRVDDDQPDPTYIMAPWGGGVFASGAMVGVKWNNRAYFTSKCQDNFDPTVFKPLYLLDKTLNMTVDVSTINCGCDASLYLVAMPAYNQYGKPDPTRCNDYYCDANEVCGIFCPEMDIMEANREALAITPHRCDAPQGGYYNSCDTGGCGQNLKAFGHHAYGYGNEYQINTRYPFNVSISFQTKGGYLHKIVTKVSQNIHCVIVTHDNASCGKGYLESMTGAFANGLVLTTSHWSGDAGSDMSWLDVPPCNPDEGCNRGGTAYFSDLALYKTSMYLPEPEKEE